MQYLVVKTKEGRREIIDGRDIPEGAERIAAFALKSDAELFMAADSLANACLAVVDNWESGDLAGAANDCSAALAEAGIEVEDEDENRENAT